MPPTANILPDEIRRAKWPHELFLINLVFNHILVFASTFGVYSTFPWMVLVVPTISFAITGYLLVTARKIARTEETQLVKSHWIVADRRNKQFIVVVLLACAAFGGGYLLAGALGWSKITTIAVLTGMGLLPFMGALLYLIVMGNFSMYQARHNKLPKEFEDQAPSPS